MPRPSPTSLSLSAVFLGTIAVVAALVAGRVRADRLAPGRAQARLTRWRGAALAGGLALVVGAMVSPLATLAAHYLFTAHLVQVTVLMGFAPPLLLLGFAGWRPRLPGPVRRVGAVVVHPAAAIVLVNVVFFGWHATALYSACLRHEELYSVQMVSLLLVSLAFWWPIVDPTRTRVMGSFFKLGYILLATVPQTFAGLLFALAGRAFYPEYPGAFGLEPLPDQQVGGALMALLSKVALFAAFSVVFLRMLSGADTDNERGDDDGGRGRDDLPAPFPPPTTPAWLGLLERGRVSEEPTPARSSPRPRQPAGTR